jgi:hypothetical protein
MMNDGPGSPGGWLGRTIVGAGATDGPADGDEPGDGEAPMLADGLAPADDVEAGALPEGAEEAEEAGADPDGSTASGWQLTIRLLITNRATRAATARTARPAIRRAVMVSIGGRV